MSENPSQQPPVADAVVRQRSRISFVWIVPIVAVLIGGFLVYRAITERGPMVTITFPTASGLEAGKTKVKYKDVEVGRVESIALAEDFSHVEVAVRLGRRGSRFLTVNTKFWIENARVSAGQVSGLGTLLSGAYIGVDPSDQGERTDRFVGLEEAPIFTSDDAGTRFQLRASSLGSVQIGAPVYFRWIRVGQVVDYALDESGNHVSLEVFVEAPHDDRVGKETLFWNASGLDVSLSPEGFEVDTVSLISLLIGGVAFETPDGSPRGAVPEGHVFPLYANKAATGKPVITFERPFLLHFEQSAAGLVVGSPVEFQGIQIGEVTDIRMVYDEELDKPVIPVRIAIQPQRVDLGIDVEERVQERWDYMVNRGLRAQLRSHNMLTGRMAVSLDFHPNPPPAAIDWSGPIPELPTLPGGMQQLLAGAEAFLARLNALPLDQIGQDLKSSVASLSAVMADAEQATPALAATLTNAEQALASANALIAPGSPVTSDLKNALRELARAARSLRLLADQLEAQPESLIRGKETGR